MAMEVGASDHLSMDGRRLVLPSGMTVSEAVPGGGDVTLSSGAISALALRTFFVEDYGAVGDGVTDDTAAFQACIDAAYAANQYCVIRFRNISYALNSAPRHDRTGNAIVALPPERDNGATMTMYFEGSPAGTTFFTNVTGQSYSASFGPPSLIGGPTVEQTGTTFGKIFSGANAEFRNIHVILPTNPTISGIDLSQVATVYLDNVEVYGGGGVPASAPTSIYSFGIRLPDGNDGRAQFGRIKTWGTYAGVVGNTSHIQGNYLAGSYHVVGLAVTGNTQYTTADGHSSMISYVITQECVHHLGSWNPTAGVISLPSSCPAFVRITMFDIEDGIAAHWYTSVDHVLDANNQLFGGANYHRVAASIGPAAGLTAVGATNFELANVDGSGTQSRDQIRMKAQGVLTETFNAGITTAASSPVTQNATGALLGLHAGDYVTGVMLRVAVAAAGTLPTTVRFALLDSTGKVLVLSSNLNALANWATGAMPFPFTAPYQVLKDGGYFAAFIVNGAWGTTQPTLLKSGTSSAAFTPYSTFAPPSFVVGGQTDLPAIGSSLALTTGGNPIYYMGLY